MTNAFQSKMTQQTEAEQFAHNLTLVAEKTRQVMEYYLQGQPITPANDLLDPARIGAAWWEWGATLLTDPQRLMKYQLEFTKQSLALWQDTAKRLMGQDSTPVINPDKRDRRFRDALWEEHPMFHFLKQAYLLTAQQIIDSVKETEGLDPRTVQKLSFYMSQVVDACAPSNFALTNPEVLRATLESHGKNLVQGMDNLLHDLEKGKGKLNISMTDEQSFILGKNIACTPGKVVFRNRMLELIQYSPTTKSVYQTPLLLIPAWINKYYILDLKPENSLVKWLVDQGYTVFIVSWVNPDASYRDVTFEQYLTEGILEALDAIRDVTGESSVNALGYCLGGTLLSITLSYLAQTGQADRIKSATLLTTMLDFSEAGELGVFIDEEQLQQLEKRMDELGYLDGQEMSTVFNLLRANELIWSFVVNNYLLGRTPFPFDLLYWNADATRMPPNMHSFYLRNMYLYNKLAQPGALTMADTPVDLSKINTPLYFLSTREDHIAPWTSTFAGAHLPSSKDVTFTLSGSGHVAGVINPPTKAKYGYWSLDKGNLTDFTDAEHWLDAATQHDGSWWEHWEKWLKGRAGEPVSARNPDASLEDAPGRYAKVRSE